MVFNLLTRRSHFVRFPSAISGDSPVLSGVPQGTVLGPLLFLIMLADINKDISESNLISFADDTQIYSKINDVTDCNTLQQDLNHVYEWASTNNMLFNAQKFYYVSFSPNKYSSLSNVYINLEYNIISPSSNVLDLGVYMYSNCTFDFHVANVPDKLGLGVGSWTSNQANEGSNPKGTRLYFVILLKNVEKSLIGTDITV